MPRCFRRTPTVAAFLLLLTLGATGCAYANEQEYHVRFASPVKGHGVVAIAVHDQRERVVSGSEDADWVGIQRGGFGNGFDVSTASGRPLAEDWAASVSDALAQGGFTPQVVPTRPQEPTVAVAQRVLGARAPASLLLIVYKWHTDTYNNATLHRDVELQVLSPSGAVTATARSGGNLELGGSLDAAGNASVEAQRAYVRTLRALLSDASVQAALQAQPAAGREGVPAQR